MIERRPHEDMARTGEVGEVGQLHTCKKAYENRNLTKLANFVDGLVGLEDSTPPYENRRLLGWSLGLPMS